MPTSKEIHSSNSTNQTERSHPQETKPLDPDQVLSLYKEQQEAKKTATLAYDQFKKTPEGKEYIRTRMIYENELNRVDRYEKKINDAKENGLSVSSEIIDDYHSSFGKHHKKFRAFERAALTAQNTPEFIRSKQSGENADNSQSNYVRAIEKSVPRPEQRIMYDRITQLRADLQQQSPSSSNNSSQRSEQTKQS